METIWHPRPGAGFASPLSVQAFVPASLRDGPTPSASQIVQAAEIESRIRALQGLAAHDLQLEGIARMLLRAEAVSSSRIEGLGMGHRRLARAEAGRHDMDAEAVVDNVHAAVEAIERARAGVPLSPSEILNTHERLVRSDPRMTRYAGSWREEQNWIGGSAASPIDAEFIPPPHHLVPDLMRDLADYAGRTDVLASIQAASLHAQFETIHPFVDGNGRVGRILIVTQLARRGIAPTAIPPISLALAGMADKYVTGLTSWRFGDPQDWFAIFLDALATSTEAIHRLTARVDELISSWFELLGSPRKHSATARLLKHMPSHPILNVDEAMKLTGQSPAAVRRAMSRLTDAGIVKRLNIATGRQGWEVVGVFQLLDELEREIGERQRAPRPTN